MVSEQSRIQVQYIKLGGGKEWRKDWGEMWQNISIFFFFLPLGSGIMSDIFVSISYNFLYFQLFFN